MLGQLVFDGGRGGPRRALLYWLPVLRCHTDPEGFLGGAAAEKSGPQPVHRGCGPGAGPYGL